MLHVTSGLVSAGCCGSCRGGRDLRAHDPDRPWDKESVNTSNLPGPCQCYWSPGVEGECVDQGSLLPLALGTEEAGEADGEHQGLDLKKMSNHVQVLIEL